MSIVLEALEKAQREGEAEDVSLQKEQARPVLETLTKPARRPGHKLLIFNLIIFTAIINLVFLRWWLNRSNTEISVNIPTEAPRLIPKIDISPIEEIKKPSRILAPRLTVTGIVWDEKTPIVLVNSKFLKKGDEILGARIIDIYPHEVKFLYGDEELTISVE